MKFLLPLVITAIIAPFGLTDEKLKGIACRSVHLGYPAPAGTEFYNEVTVDKSAEGTYFMVCGWSKGYFGIQEQGKEKKVVIFSVWDPTAGNDPATVKDEDRVKMLHKDDAVRVKRFGGEGTGGQSFYDYDWKVGETYKFLVRATKESDTRTAYAGYFFNPEKKEWIHLVTFSTITKGALLQGYYSFVEDFKRNKISTTHERMARFNNGWIKDKDGKWVSLAKAKFTADANPVLNINAGVKDNVFFLGTGGDLENKDTPLGKTMERPAGKEPPAMPK
ncbi:DUF3472 domain-containing protein [Zavarzinella formosa]|uniref:DUF3472 domain-containing protein n=1 Tax=Zavarzinella formosa TaxID=360055 RepID=UPI0002EC2155|nr:DUF3472 domain-containing protein [Zavarzinella formosa]